MSKSKGSLKLIFLGALSLLGLGNLNIPNEIPKQMPIQQEVCNSIEDKLRPIYEEAKFKSGIQDCEPIILVSGKEQKLYLTWVDGEKLIVDKEYLISTGENGIGEPKIGRHKTPSGLHVISEKAGDESPIGMLFIGRRAKSKICKIHTTPDSERHYDVTTRILKLDPLEENNKDLFYKSFYIHGTPEEYLVGVPSSKGCIRMKNTDAVDLYNLVNVGTYVYIVPE